MLAGRTALGVLALMVAGSLAAAQEQRSSRDAPAQPPPVQSSSSETSSPAQAEDGASKPAQDSAPRPAEDGAQKSRLVSILGREVANRDGDGGRVIDVLVDLDGRSGAVVVEFGGFMGIGSRKVAVDWNALRFVREGNRSLLIIDVSREQIKGAPEYKPSEPPAVISTK